MGIEFFFWRQEKPLSLSAAEVSRRLNCEEKIEGLAELPVELILEALQEELQHFELLEFHYTSHHFWFGGASGLNDPDEFNALIEIMADYGCALYDPQLNIRYDSAGGTEVGNLPDFDTPISVRCSDVLRHDRRAAVSSVEDETKSVDQTASEFGFSWLRVFKVLGWLILLSLPMSLANWYSAAQERKEKEKAKEIELQESMQELFHSLETQEGGDAFRRLYGLPAKGKRLADDTGEKVD